MSDKEPTTRVSNNGKRTVWDRPPRPPRPVEPNLTPNTPLPNTRKAKPRYVPYGEKLRDPRWQKKRLEILERDGFTCQACGDDKATLHVHHKEYQNGQDPWDYPAETMVTLCESCHTWNRELSKQFQDFATIVKPAACFELLQCLICVANHKNAYNRRLLVSEFLTLASHVHTLFKAHLMAHSGEETGERSRKAKELVASFFAETLREGK